MVEDKFEELETERLILRKITDDDALMLYDNIYNNYEWYKFYYQLPFNSFEEYQKLVEKYKDWYDKGNHFRWGIVLKETKEMIGLVQLRSRDNLNNSCKIGYIISYKFTGNGYAKEAVEKILDFGINKLGYHRIEADVVSENKDSVKLAKSVGMTFESVKKESYRIKDTYYDQDVYTLIKKN